MSYRKKIKRYLVILAHPEVIIFMIIGIAIIFLTFLTDNNAIEIAISAMASVFIGIAVNIFTSFEMRQPAEGKINTKIAQSIKLMEITNRKIQNIRKDLYADDENLDHELSELQHCIEVTIGLIQDSQPV